MKLSILIPTLEDRKEQYYELSEHIYSQIDSCQYFKKNVELHFLRDNGEKSVGAKRQQLLEWAAGDYICFVDDDDQIPDDYVARILGSIDGYITVWGTEPDCCSLSGELHWLGNNTTEPFEHSIKHQKWEKQDGVYLRYPNHLNAVRRDLALQVGFKNMGHGEDRDYSDRLKPLLKTEAPIDGVIYHYNCRG